MLMELLSKAATVAMLSFVVSSMLAMGAGLTVSQISEPLRNARLVLMQFLPLASSPWRRCSGSITPLQLDCWCSGARPARRSCRSLPELAKGNLACAVMRHTGETFSMMCARD